MKVYVVVEIVAYIPYVNLVTPDRESAIDRGIALAKTGDEPWKHDKLSTDGEIYFNQEEDGNMENAVSVQEVGLSLKSIDLVFDNDDGEAPLIHTYDAGQTYTLSEEDGEYVVRLKEITNKGESVSA